MQQDDETTLRYLRAGEVYQAALQEIFEEPPKAFAERFPLLAIAWRPFMSYLLDRHFDIDSLRKTASDLWDFQHWLMAKKWTSSDIPLSLVDPFIRDLRALHRKKSGYAMDSDAIRDVRGAIDCFLDFATRRSRPKRPKTDGPS